MNEYKIKLDPDKRGEFTITMPMPPAPSMSIEKVVAIQSGDPVAMVVRVNETIEARQRLGFRCVAINYLTDPRIGEPTMLAFIHFHKF